MDFLNTRVIKCFPAPLGHEPVLVIFHFFSCHKWSKKDVMDKPQINKQESFVKFTHSFFCFLHHFSFPFTHLSFHPLCKNIWSHAAASDDAVTMKPLFSLGKNTHICTRRAVKRKQLRDVIGQMRIIGLQFGLGQGECLAAARQRRAI